MSYYLLHVFIFWGKWKYVNIHVSEVEFYSKAHSKNEFGSTLK